ncbi:MAG TPA: IS66 family transposase [Bryobacteraceae bacterium]|nr:IS66 family transposase [Bryobacteraceae bacterium]
MKTLITNELFSDFVECRYRGYLKITGASGPTSDLIDVSGRLREGYHSQAREHLLRTYRDKGKQACTDVGLSVVLANRYDLAIDVTATDTNVSVRFDALMAAPGNATGSQPDYIPIIFVNNDKVSREDELRLALCAWVLIRWHACRPSFGRILHSSDFRIRKIKLARVLEQADRALEEICALAERPSEPPLLHLNTHCPTCVFKNNCRETAIEKDDLSLLRGIKEKEIVKLRNKGIFTVTQLSYTFRPRKKSKRSNPLMIKYYHALKALALREKRIYVVGKPELTITGTPVYIDVEGTPDRDSYYLIGLRIPGAAAAVQRSLWANDRADEENIWKEFLQVITTLDNPQLIYYGSYETVFLRRLKKRYGDTSEDGHSVVNRLTKSAQNVLSVVYGRVYFPTYSNSLKDIASYLGFNWSIEEPSGQRSLALRREWELTGSETAKQDLINYNADDCTALEVLVQTLLQLIPRDTASPTALPYPNAVHVDSLKPQMPYRFGPVDFVFPELDQINRCAYWDYQRDRIYVRSNPRLRRVARRNQRKKRRHSLPVNVTVSPSRPWTCPGCNSRKIRMNGRHSKLLYDLRFTTGGVKRWISKYFIDHYKCSNCGKPFASDVHEWTRHRYGLQLLAYVIHNIIELHIPQMKLSGSMLKLFDYDIGQPTINRLKRRAAELYQGAYEDIKETLLHGGLIHADETHMNIKDSNGYVWVFTSMEEVIYLWSATREGKVVEEFLRGFQGVLVSDFYSAYDSIDCAQQKCLIHLIRDLNEDVLNEPFNEELKRLVHEFAELLKPIIGTIDRFGLKTHFLKKHKVQAARFYDRLGIREYKTELARKAQERLRRNQGKLFTFLDHDDIPWNNNNAEHAVKAFGALRNVIEPHSTETSIREHLVLLSICQTCEYRGIDFLQFLRSGEKRVDDYLYQISRPRVQVPPRIRSRQHFLSDPTR